MPASEQSRQAHGEEGSIFNAAYEEAKRAQAARVGLNPEEEIPGLREEETQEPTEAAKLYALIEAERQSFEPLITKEFLDCALEKVTPRFTNGQTNQHPAWDALRGLANFAVLSQVYKERAKIEEEKAALARSREVGSKSAPSIPPTRNF